MAPQQLYDSLCITKLVLLIVCVFRSSATPSAAGERKGDDRKEGGEEEGVSMHHMDCADIAKVKGDQYRILDHHTRPVNTSRG